MLLESTLVSRSIEAGNFTPMVWGVLLLNGLLAMVGWGRGPGRVEPRLTPG